MADMIKFFKGAVSSLPSSGVSGAIYITSDEGGIYLGTGTGMKRLGDFIQVDAVANLPTTGANTSALYYCVAENVLAKWNGASWTQVNRQKTAAELKEFLGLGALAYLGEVSEDNLSSDLKEKVNAASEGNHSHNNKALLDTYTQTEADLADAVAKKHTHANADELAKITTGDVEKWNNKVDKVTGKSLVSDTEITKLAGVSEGANKVEASTTNGKIKIDGTETTVYTHPDKHAISEVTGLQDALDLKLEDSDIKNKADKATTLAGYGIGDAYTKTEVDSAVNAKVASVTAGDASVTIGGTATAPTVVAKISEDADNALELTDGGLKVVIPAAAEYSIVKAADSGDYAAVYNLTKDGAVVGASINIPKDLVVKTGSVVGDEIVLVLNDEAKTEIKIPVGSLIEYVTSGSTTGDMIVVNVSDDHKVTATITDGTITLVKLDTDTQTKINKAHSHENISVLNGITADKVKAWDAAQANAEAKAAELDTALKEEIVGTADDESNATTIYGVKTFIIEAMSEHIENANERYATKTDLEWGSF